MSKIYLRCLAITIAGGLLWACSAGKKPGNAAAVTNVAPDSGKQLFTTHCISCHQLDKEEIGPRLGGITDLLSADHLKAFIKNPAKFAEKGDRRMAALTNRYKMVMPPFDFLSDAEVGSILSYIGAESKRLGIAPLVVDTSDVTGSKPARLGEAVIASDLRIELSDFVTIPPSSDKMPRTRIATMRTHPSADGTLFVSDQRGIIYRIEKGKPEVFLDIRQQVEHYVNEPGLGTGLGSFAFHPDFLKNGLIYITHTETFTGKKADYAYADSIKVALQWVVSEWKMDDVNAKVFKGLRRELIRINVPGSVHGTQEINFKPDIAKNDPDYGLLYIGTGDGGSTIGGHPELCHSLKSLLGTIIRIDPLGRNSKNGNYGIPGDNPFVSNAESGIYQEIYAYGFRNPHRMTWFEGKMLSAEVGEANFEEINLIEKGKDYGWNVREGAYAISAKDLKTVFPAEKGEKGSFTSPYAAYEHVDGNAICGGYVYQGPLTALQGKYIFADIMIGKLFYLDPNVPANPKIYEMFVMKNSVKTSFYELTGSKRIDLRVEYDPNTHDMYIMTKPDGKIRKITNAYVLPDASLSR